jgi:hypothetical protein
MVCRNQQKAVLLARCAPASSHRFLQDFSEATLRQPDDIFLFLAQKFSPSADFAVA